MDRAELKELKIHAIHARQNALRMIKANGSGHMGPSFSCMDIVTALYFHTMNVDPKNPDMPERDRFLLSAGHKGMAQYSVLGEMGFFDADIYDTYGQFKCLIPGHPDMHKLPGIEASTGSLGHGINIAVGMALGLRQDKSPARVFTITGDGELAEGSNWEGVAAAAHYKLDNLCIIVDANGLQISGNTWDVMSYEPLKEHFEGFGCAVKEINGNNMEEVVEALDSLPFCPGKPNVIIARDIKACGYAPLENKVNCHYWAPKPEEMAEAEALLAAALKEVEAE